MTATLAKLVEMVRAEAGHSLAVSQGLNAEETIKQLIRRAEEELRTALPWPQIKIRWDIDVMSGEAEYRFPPVLKYEDITHVYYAYDGRDRFYPVKAGIPENAIPPHGATSSTEHAQQIMLWDIYYNMQAKESRLRVWPTPSSPGVLRLVGWGPLKPLIDDDDYCTLDPTLIVLCVASRLLTRAKAADAEMVDRNFQRHLAKLQARFNSDKNKVSTLGDTRYPDKYRLRRGLDYMD